MTNVTFFAKRDEARAAAKIAGKFKDMGADQAAGKRWAVITEESAPVLEPVTVAAVTPAPVTDEVTKQLIRAERFRTLRKLLDNDNTVLSTSREQSTELLRQQGGKQVHVKYKRTFERATA